MDKRKLLFDYLQAVDTLRHTSEATAVRDSISLLGSDPLGANDVIGWDAGLDAPRKDSGAPVPSGEVLPVRRRKKKMTRMSIEAKVVFITPHVPGTAREVTNSINDPNIRIEFVRDALQMMVKRGLLKTSVEKRSLGRGSNGFGEMDQVVYSPNPNISAVRQAS